MSVLGSFSMHQEEPCDHWNSKDVTFLFVLWSHKEGKKKKSVTGTLNTKEGTYPSFASTVSGARIEHLEKKPPAQCLSLGHEELMKFQVTNSRTYKCYPEICIYKID